MGISAGRAKFGLILLAVFAFFVAFALHFVPGPSRIFFLSDLSPRSWSTVDKIKFNKNNFEYRTELKTFEISFQSAALPEPKEGNKFGYQTCKVEGTGEFSSRGSSSAYTLETLYSPYWMSVVRETVEIDGERYETSLVWFKNR